MNLFLYRNSRLFAEEVSLLELAKDIGTPCYVYSQNTIQKTWKIFDDALADISHLICYAVKANSNLAVLNSLSQLGSGFDVVSQGELERVLRAKGNPKKIVFSGVAKTETEIYRALEVGILAFNVESISELERIHFIAQKFGKRAFICLRLNPDVDVKTHPYIATGLKENKFGIPIEQAIAAFDKAESLSSIDVIGIGCHIGSQLLEVEPFIVALEKILEVIKKFNQRKVKIKYLNLGGGLGVRYQQETPPSLKNYTTQIIQRLKGRGLKLIVEPGRAIVANAGILLTRVECIKNISHKSFAIVDAGMTELLRPALYKAWHDIIPVQQHDDVLSEVYDVVGPVCETADFLAHHRKLAIEVGDILAVCQTGAYGFVMSSNYNSRHRPPEVMVNGKHYQVVRARENFDDLIKGESFFI